MTKTFTIKDGQAPTQEQLEEFSRLQNAHLIFEPDRREAFSAIVEFL